MIARVVTEPAVADPPGRGRPVTIPEEAAASRPSPAAEVSTEGRRGPSLYRVVLSCSRSQEVDLF